MELHESSFARKAFTSRKVCAPNPCSCGNCGATPDPTSTTLMVCRVSRLQAHEIPQGVVGRRGAGSGVRLGFDRVHEVGNDAVLDEEHREVIYINQIVIALCGIELGCEAARRALCRPIHASRPVENRLNTGVWVPGVVRNGGGIASQLSYGSKVAVGARARAWTALRDPLWSKCVIFSRAWKSSKGGGHGHPPDSVVGVGRPDALLRGQVSGGCVDRTSSSCCCLVCLSSTVSPRQVRASGRIPR